MLPTYIGFTLSWLDVHPSDPFSRYCDVHIVDRNSDLYRLDVYATPSRGSWGEPSGCLQPGWRLEEWDDTQSRLDAIARENGGRTGIMPMIGEAMRQVMREAFDLFPDERFAMFGRDPKRATFYRSWGDLDPRFRSEPTPWGMIWNRIDASEEVIRAAA